MNTELNLEAILADTEMTTRGYRRPKKLAQARRVEQSRRAAHAQTLAKRALVAIHRDEYDMLYRQAVVKINTERGPLPGDPE